MKLFLTGTDTGVGKTYTACALVRQLRKEGRDCVGLKPICCGDRGDALALQEAAGKTLALEQVNPVWLATPASPYAASLLENRPVDLPPLLAACRRMVAAHESVIVEGVGGWFVPIRRDYFISDLAGELGLPIAVVVANRLGAVNHTLLTVRAILARGLPCAGVLLSQTAPCIDSIVTSGNRTILEDLLEVPILGELAYGARTIQWLTRESPALR